MVGVFKAFFCIFWKSIIGTVIVSVWYSYQVPTYSTAWRFVWCCHFHPSRLGLPTFLSFPSFLNTWVITHTISFTRMKGMTTDSSPSSKSTLTVWLLLLTTVMTPENSCPPCVFWHLCFLSSSSQVVVSLTDCLSISHSVIASELYVCLSASKSLTLSFSIPPSLP